MECFVQYLDDLDDLFYAFALIWERIRGKLRFALFVGMALSLQLAGVFLGLANPPLALAAVSLLLVTLMLHGTINYTAVDTAEA
jgi:hypothetical protein